MKFKIGDRVKHIKNDDWGVGAIVYIDNDDIPYLVEFNKDFCGHNGDGHGKSDHCWWCNENNIKLVEGKNVDKLIFRDNATILFKDGKRYVAKCCEGDTYDKEKGLLVCLAKANGISFNDLQEMLAGAEYQGNYKITLSEFLTRQGARIAINTKTEYQFMELLRICKNKGHFVDMDEDVYFYNNEETCLSRLFNYGFSKAGFYKSQDCKIYDFTEVDLRN